MAHGAEKRRAARKAYIYERLSIPAVAVKIGVPAATLRRWKREAREKGDDWDAARAAIMLSGEGLEAVVSSVVEEFTIQFHAALDQLKNEDIAPDERVKLMASLSDAFNKMVSAAGRVAPKISQLSVALDVLRRLGEYIREHHPDQAETFLAALEPFGEQLAEVYG